MPRAEVYTHAHVLIGGFTQRLGRRGNGVWAVFDALYRRWAAPHTIVVYAPWYLHPRDLAATIADWSTDCLATHGRPLRLQIAGYSYGGQTAAHVCRELDRRHRQVLVDRLCLCDAVARRGRLGLIAAANPWARIRVPANVRRLTWFRQQHARFQPRLPLFHPRGHRVLADGVHTAVYGPIELDCQHTEADDAPAWHEQVLLDARAIHADEPLAGLAAAAPPPARRDALRRAA